MKLAREEEPRIALIDGQKGQVVPLTVPDTKEAEKPRRQEKAVRGKAEKIMPQVFG